MVFVSTRRSFSSLKPKKTKRLSIAAKMVPVVVVTWLVGWLVIPLFCLAHLLVGLRLSSWLVDWLVASLWAFSWLWASLGLIVI